MEAKEYSVFVAMPFAERFRYSKKKVLEDIIRPAAMVANGKLACKDDLVKGRRFATPRIVADTDRRAKDIHDEIVKGILDAHVVVADLTLHNDGALIEFGVALGLKPTSSLVLLSQEDPSQMHFDIMTNVILRYESAADVEKIAGAMVGAVFAFEEDRKRYMTQLSRTLSPDAVTLLRWYGMARCGLLKKEDGTHFVASLHDEMGVYAFQRQYSNLKAVPDYQQTAAITRYHLALRELLEHRLIWTDYVVGEQGVKSDEYAGRATRLGWMFLEMTWNDLKRPANESDPT